jgi:hypothetical protein
MTSLEPRRKALGELCCRAQRSRVYVLTLPSALLAAANWNVDLITASHEPSSCRVQSASRFGHWRVRVWACSKNATPVRCRRCQVSGRGNRVRKDRLIWFISQSSMCGNTGCVGTGVAQRTVPFQQVFGALNLLEIREVIRATLFRSGHYSPSQPLFIFSSRSMVVATEVATRPRTDRRRADACRRKQAFSPLQPALSPVPELIEPTIPIRRNVVIAEERNRTCRDAPPALGDIFHLFRNESPPPSLRNATLPAVTQRVPNPRRGHRARAVGCGGWCVLVAEGLAKELFQKARTSAQPRSAALPACSERSGLRQAISGVLGHIRRALAILDDFPWWVHSRRTWPIRLRPQMLLSRSASSQIECAEAWANCAVLFLAFPSYCLHSPSAWGRLCSPFCTAQSRRSWNRCEGRPGSKRTLMGQETRLERPAEEIPTTTGARRMTTR